MFISSHVSVHNIFYLMARAVEPLISFCWVILRKPKLTQNPKLINGVPNSVCFFCISLKQRSTMQGNKTTSLFWNLATKSWHNDPVMTYLTTMPLHSPSLWAGRAKPRDETVSLLWSQQFFHFHPRIRRKKPSQLIFTGSRNFDTSDLSEFHNNMQSLLIKSCRRKTVYVYV